MVEEQEIARIVARLALADDSFIGVMIQSAKNAGQQMLPEDIATLEKWAIFMRALSRTLEKSGTETIGK